MGKIKQWIVSHKLISIAAASVLAVGVSLSVALPLALGHKHTFSEDWLHDETNHWRICTSEDCDATSGNDTHIFVEERDEEQYWNKCSVCGYEQEKINAKVANDEVLRYALFFKDAEANPYTNLVAVCEGYNTLGEVSKNVKFTEKAYYIYDSNNDGISSPKEKMYVNESDGTKATYSKVNENAGWTRVVEKHSDNFYMFAKNAIFLSGVNDFTFDYNQADSTYVATKDDAAGNQTIKYIVKFANGKIVSAVYEKIAISAQNAIVHYAWTISYGNATIEVPTEITAVTEDQWENALSFDGVKDFTETYKSADRTIFRKATENSAYKKSIMPQGYSGDFETIYDLTNKKQYNRNVASNGTVDKKYTVTDVSYLTYNTMLSNVNFPVSRYNSIKNSFDSFEYKADEKVYYAASANIDGSTYQDVKLTFDNGKLMKVEYTRTNALGNAETNTLTYTYGNTEINMPTDSNCIFDVAYDDSSEVESYVLSNVNLKANETKTFVINITDGLFSANKGTTDKCNIIGEFTTSDSMTFEIKVKDANGTELDNIASNGNEFDCDVSVAGKYYIEITASADCTGSWDIGFVAPTPAAGSTKEAAIAINWSSSDKKFAISDVALSTTEKWFVLEITEESHSTYKRTSGKYKLDKTVTLSSGSDATVTVVAENESGTEMDLASLDAGKYYIKVTADKDCTGALSFAFDDGKFSM